MLLERVILHTYDAPILPDYSLPKHICDATFENVQEIT